MLRTMMMMTVMMMMMMMKMLLARFLGVDSLKRRRDGVGKRDQIVFVSAAASSHRRSRFAPRMPRDFRRLRNYETCNRRMKGDVRRHRHGATRGTPVLVLF